MTPANYDIKKKLLIATTCLLLMSLVSISLWYAGYIFAAKLNIALVICQICYVAVILVRETKP